MFTQKLSLTPLIILALSLSSCEKAPVAVITQSAPPESEYSGRIIEHEPIKLSSGESQLLLNYVFPKNHEYAEGAPSSIKPFSSDINLLSFNKIPETVNLYETSGPYPVQLKAQPGETNLTVDSLIYYCDKVSKICISDRFRTKIPVTIESTPSNSPTKIDLPLIEQKI